MTFNWQLPNIARRYAFIAQNVHNLVIHCVHV